MQPDDLYYDPCDYAIDADPHPVWRRMRVEEISGRLGLGSGFAYGRSVK